MIHVEKAEVLVELQLVLADGMQILRRQGPLRNYRTDNGGDRQGDEEKHGQFKRTEKIQDELGILIVYQLSR